MTKTALYLPVIGLAFSLASPIGAFAAPALVAGDSAIYQQNTCKDGEVWDETQKKCVKQ